jgi:ABC-type cobalamin transport system permease subunit
MIGPPVLSLVVLIAGLFARKHSRQAGSALLVIGIGGVILSGAWIAFAFYVDAVLGDT